MCSPRRCRTCSKTTWSGCGQHVAMIKMTVPASDWCNGSHTRAEIDEAKAARAASGQSLFGRLFGR